MEVEDEDILLQRLFFKKFGSELPEKKSDDVDIGMDLKDLTKEQDKMEAIPSLALVDIFKKESIKIPKAIIQAVNHAKIVEWCLVFGRAPSREKSDFKRKSSKLTSLFKVDIKSPSDDASQNGLQCRTVGD